jgi:hypothetical protein
MRKLAILIPIAMVGVYVAHEVATGSESQSDTVWVAEAPVAPVAPVAPLPPVAPVAPTAPVAPVAHVTHVEPVTAPAPGVVASAIAEQAALAGVTIQLPELEQLDVEFLNQLTVSAAARAEFAANLDGFLEAFEHLGDEVDGEAMAITGSVLAELAASLEGYVKVATKDGNLVLIADTNKQRRH